MNNLDEKIVIPSEDRLTSIKPEEAAFICNFIKEHSVTKTLEVGFAYGYSAAYIIEATHAKHIVIDPYQEAYKNLGIKNIEALGFTDKLDHRKKTSHEALPEILQEGKMFEFVFIDGGHKYDEIFIDWYYADLLLQQKGFILFHDSWMRSTQMVAEFIRTNRTDYQEIPTGVENLILFQKIGLDDRPWHHFKEFK